MSKILLIGMSPMPFENDLKVYGTGIRTWQFLLPLLEAGHQICVCNYAIPSAFKKGFDTKSVRDFRYLNYVFEYHTLKKEDFENLEVLLEICNDFNPDCLVGCTFYPSFTASKLIQYLRNSEKMDANDKKAVPMWGDLFGHVMAEAQARAFMDDNNGCLFHYWNSEYNIITTADVFSCVSGRQEYALIGELGAVGRLSKKTSGYDFTAAIPCGLPAEDYRHEKVAFRGMDGIETDDFVVLWTGGYNTWTDIDTLFKGLETSMKSNSKIKFVSTGGEIPEQDVVTYPRFLEMIKNSPFRDRFIMKGWIAGQDVPGYYLEADIGINIDKDIYEVRLGSKNRILDWFRAGLCVLSSNVCELTEIMEREKIGFTFKPYDAEDLSRRIIFLAENPGLVKKTGKAGRDYGFREFNFNRTTEKLLAWAADPGFAPDAGIKGEIFFSKEEALKNLEQIVKKQIKMIEERDVAISELKGLLARNPACRFYNYLKFVKKKLSNKWTQKLS